MNILDIPMEENGAGAGTIRQYLIALLAELWRDGEDFSGKRPFGNSGWQFEVYDALIKAGAVPGAHGQPKSVVQADLVVVRAIHELLR